MKKFSRTYVPVVPLLLLASKCLLVYGTPSTLTLDNLNLADGSPTLGQGYSLTTNSFVYSSCFDINATRAEQSYNYNFDFIDFIDEEEWESKFQAKKIAKSFAYDKIKNVVETSPRYTAVTTLRIDRFSSSLFETGDDLSLEYKHMLNDKKYVNFFSSCGPNYVRSLRSAQEVTAIITFDADDDATARSFADYLKRRILGNGSSRDVDVEVLIMPSSSPTISAMPSLASPSLSPSELPSSEPSSQFDTYVPELTNSLLIEIIGNGVALDNDNSKTLVATSLEELNEVMAFAMDSMTKYSSKGIVYKMEYTPWTDNAEFLKYAGVHYHKIYAPVPRGMIENARSEPSVCSKSSSRSDDFGKCCSPHELISFTTVNYMGSTVQMTRCEPKRLISSEIMKENLQTNSEFIAWMASVQKEKENSLSKLGECVRNLRALPDEMEYKFLLANDEAVHDPSLHMQYTVKELKAALDPYADLEIINMVSSENDEYFEMFYDPCISALYEMQYGEKKLSDPKFIMSRPWYNVENCKRISCLDKNMAWDRWTGDGCVTGLLGRHNKGDPIPQYSDAYCAKQVNATSAEESCKYDYVPNSDFVVGMDNCRKALPQGTDGRGGSVELSLAYVMAYFCLPNVAVDIDAADSHKMGRADYVLDKCTAPIDDTLPSAHPSEAPTNTPSIWSDQPSSIPSSPPSLYPSEHPSAIPTGTPSISTIPSLVPSRAPFSKPSVQPSGQPTWLSGEPSISAYPSTMPSNLHSSKPSAMPSNVHSSPPSTVPSISPQPTEDPCIDEENGELKDQFRILMSPGDDASDISFTVHGRTVNAPFDLINVFERDDYDTSEPDQESAKCLWRQLCMFVTVYSASGNGIGTGSFEAYWKGRAILFDDPDFTSGYSTKSRQFGRCADIPSVPSQAPSLTLAPSVQPSIDPCPEEIHGINKDSFRMVVTPGSDPSDLSWRVFRRGVDGVWGDQDVFENTDYTTTDADQESQKCIWNRICMKVVVYSASGNGMQGGSFAAYWNGVPIEFADATFATGSSTESEIFGLCE